jgi:vitamin B12 transporter
MGGDAEGESGGSQAESAESETRDDGYRESVVVTATKTETAREKVGNTVTVVDPDDSIPLAGRLLTDILRQVPGLDVRRSGGVGSETSVFIRGADSDHTLLLVDGVELNDPSTPSRTSFGTHLTLDAVERVEVLRGPQGSLYGSDAIGGVINVITRAPGERRAARAWVEGGSYSSAAAGFSWEQPAGSGGLALAGSQSETRGFSSSSGGTEDDAYRNRSFSLRYGVPLGARVTLDASVRGADAETDFDGFARESGHRIDSEQLLARVEPRVRSASGAWEHRFPGAYARHARTTAGDFPSEIAGELLTLGWTAARAAGSRHRMLFGAESSSERADFGASTARSVTSSLFVQDQLRISDAISATLGARWDDHDAFGARVTARGAIAWRLAGDSVVLRASGGTGFKAPSLAELDPGQFAGNPSLRPETSAAWDAGVEYTTPSRRAHVGATLFASQFDELIVALFDPGRGTFFNANVDEARAKGVELYGAISLAPKTQLRGRYTWTDTEAVGSPARFGLADGQPLLRRPEHKAGLTLDRRLAARPRARLALDVEYVGERKEIDPTSFSVADAEAHVVANAMAAWPLGDALTLEARVENLFDEDYEDVLGFGAAGRSLFAGLSLELDRDR